MAGCKNAVHGCMRNLEGDIMSVCECGCGQELTGKQIRWKNDGHKNEFYTRARRMASGKIRAVLTQAVESECRPLPIPVFFNTVKLEGSELTEANQKASCQEDVILQFFISSHRDYTPCEVARNFPEWPITSIRRAITNLTKRGKLIKTSEKRKGAYGVENFCWTAA